MGPATFMPNQGLFRRRFGAFDVTASMSEPGGSQKALRQVESNGGEGGIRTHVPVTRQDAFEAPPLRPLRYLSGRVAVRTGHYTALTRHDPCRASVKRDGRSESRLRVRVVTDDTLPLRGSAPRNHPEGWARKPSCIMPAGGPAQPRQRCVKPRPGAVAPSRRTQSGRVRRARRGRSAGHGMGTRLAPHHPAARSPGDAA